MVVKYNATERQREIYDYFNLHGIAATEEKYKLSRSRIYQIRKTVLRHDGKKEYMGDMFGLSMRAYYALARKGIKEKAELINLLNSEGIDGLKKIRGLGKEGIKEVVNFVGELC